MIFSRYLSEWRFYFLRFVEFHTHSPLIISFRGFNLTFFFLTTISMDPFSSSLGSIPNSLSSLGFFPLDVRCKTSFCRTGEWFSGRFSVNGDWFGKFYTEIWVLMILWSRISSDADRNEKVLVTSFTGGSRNTSFLSVTVFFYTCYF